MPDDQTPPTPPHQRRVLPLVLVGLATLIGLLSVFALWAKRQALETETWTDTSSELLQNESIRDAVSDFVVQALFDNVAVQDKLAAALPPQLAPLAGPAAGGLRQLAGKAADDALASPKVQALWEDANRIAHERLLAAIDDEGEFTSTGGGVVTLDLTKIVGDLATEIGIGGDVASKLPEGASSIEIMRSDELETVQTGVKALRTLAYVLSFLTLGLYVLAVGIATGRRRETLRAVGFSFFIIGALTLLARSVAGDAVTSSLTATAAAEGPVQATWTIGTSLLKETAQSLIVYGIAIVLAAWLAGPTPLATSAREAATPYLRRPAWAFGGLAVLVALLFWWDPVVATHRVVPSLVLIALLAIGVEALRRQVIREFPDRVATHSPQGIAQRMATRARETRGRKAERRHGAAPGSQPDSRLSDLERLAHLRETGVLTEAEAEAEKRRILGGG